MTPNRINHRGTLLLDRVFKGVGRVRRASGTNDPRMFRLMDAMLGTLKQAGRVDILQAIRSGALTPLEVWSRFRVSDLDSLPTAETMKPLKVALEAWLEDADTGPDNRASRRYAVRALLKHAPSDATVADLPGALQKFGKSSAKDHPTMFNRSRAAALAFVRDEMGRSHPIYGRIRDLRPKKEAKRPGHPLTVEGMQALAVKLAPHGPMAWAMAVSGLGPTEYWGEWAVLPDRIRIDGTKRKGRVREVLRVWPIPAPTLSYTHFAKLLKSVTGGYHTCRDLRRTFSTWMELAGIPRTRRRIYMGHGTKDVTDLYERVEIERYLAEDSERMRRLLGETPPPEQVLRLA